MIDVLLTHSYHLYYDRKQARKMQPYPPLGTLYAASLLRQHGYSVAVFDSMLEDPMKCFPEMLRRTKPRMVALCEDNFNFLSKMCLSRMREVALEIIKVSKEAGVLVAVNGSDSTDHKAQYLSSGADFIMIGEVERTLLSLVDSLLGGSGEDPVEIPGLAYLKPQSGKLYKTPPRPLITDLDELPLPARDLVDVGRYREAWKAAHGIFSLNMVTGRGCPYQCNWCAKPIYGDRFHLRSAEGVAREMASVKNEFGAEHVWFADDIFGIKHTWVMELAEQVERLGAAIRFKMQTRADLMKENVAAAFRRAGCEEAWMGVESGSQKVLDAMDKGLKVDQVAQARENLRRSGIRACYFLQFGYPGETWQDISKTIDLVRTTQPDDVGISVSYPLPGTDFHARVREQLGFKTNWIDSEDVSMMFKGAYTTEFYRALRDAIHAEVETWSQPSFSSLTKNDHRHERVTGDEENLREMWRRVEGYEKICRNESPTLLPVLTCATEALC